jgi:hypothetical protein
MNFEKSRESINKLLENNTRIRWGILVLSAILFIIILYPSLVITKHRYNVGDVVERDIKAAKDFSLSKTRRQPTKSASRPWQMC